MTMNIIASGSIAMYTKYIQNLVETGLHGAWQRFYRNNIPKVETKEEEELLAVKLYFEVTMIFYVYLVMSLTCIFCFTFERIILHKKKIWNFIHKLYKHMRFDKKNRVSKIKTYNRIKAKNKKIL